MVDLGKEFVPHTTHRSSIRASQSGFSLLELMIAMVITLLLMSVVFALVRQNQQIFATETGVTSMNENVRASVDLLTRELQSAGSGMRGFSAPILGVDGEKGQGDAIAIILGDPYAPVAQVRGNSPWANGVTQVALIEPAGLVDRQLLTYLDDRGKPKRLYDARDRYVLYNGTHFLIVRISSYTRAQNGDILVGFYPDKSNPRARFGNYQFDHKTDLNGALFARLQDLVTYRHDKEAELLERRENNTEWAAVARGITGFQVRYRVLHEDQTLSDPLDAPPSDRAAIRSVVVTLRARTPDIRPESPQYRETAEHFEVTPRNMRFPRGNGNDVEPPPV